MLRHLSSIEMFSYQVHPYRIHGFADLAFSFSFTGKLTLSKGAAFLRHLIIMRHPSFQQTDVARTPTISKAVLP